MAIKTKKEVKEDKKEVSKTTSTKSSVAKKNTAEKKETSKKSVTKKIESKKIASKEKAKVNSKTTAKTTAKSKISANKSATKASSKKTSSASKATAPRKTSSRTKSTAKPMLVEYYDLPYGYNETTVKILAQTPTALFVYWDISEDDRNKLTSKYGENFFYESRPILIVHNNTKNYSFEIEINDFANSWYIRCQEPNCDYTIELGRKIIERPQEYIYIDSSNDIISPNDHILFEKSDLGHVRFRNVKTGVISEKDYGSLRFINNIDRLYGNIYDVYSALYNKETLNGLTNPSSGEFIMK